MFVIIEPEFKEKLAIFQEKAKHLPVHDLDDYGKDYIDYLGFKNNPITRNAMRGVDQYDRKFCVLKIIVFDPKARRDEDKVLFFMDTFFQRYTQQNMYHVCGHFMHHTIETFGGISLVQLQYYIDLLTKGKATITREIRPYLEEIIGWIAMIGNEQEWKAAKIIQRRWREARENPEYYMCKRVQIRDAMGLGVEFSWEYLKEMFPTWKEEDFRKVFPNLSTKDYIV